MAPGGSALPSGPITRASRESRRSTTLLICSASIPTSSPHPEARTAQEVTLYNFHTFGSSMTLTITGER